MLSKLFNIIVLLLAIQSICSVTSLFHRKKHEIDITQYNSMFYDPTTGLGLKAKLETFGKNPFNTKIAFRGLSCNCEELTCRCCAGINITALNFNRLACTKFVYEPDELAIKMTISMNEKDIYSNTIAARNPPPLCAPFPYLPILNFCVRFYDIFTVGRNLHACIDLETRIIGQPILILHFNCVKLGVDGISWSKPGEPSNNTALGVHPQVSEPEVYDDVDFEQLDLEVYANYTSTLTPEEEAQIGQLKL
ncbi:unnamed protein product [Xylocopa violacea]|uniref:DUF4773 domain-containing protein n=1 Tax=Xylocopa violacea TaxID=135666 RepID=A0ABP1NAK4_XYLVO